MICVHAEFVIMSLLISVVARTAFGYQRSLLVHRTLQQTITNKCVGTTLRQPSRITFRSSTGISRSEANDDLSWMDEQKEVLWNKKLQSEEAFEDSRRQWRSAREKYRKKKLQLLKKEIFGTRRAQRTPRQQEEWVNLVDAITKLDESAYAHMLKAEGGQNIPEEAPPVPDSIIEMYDPKSTYYREHQDQRLSPHLPATDLLDRYKVIDGQLSMDQPTFEELTRPVIAEHAEQLKEYMRPWTPPAPEAVLRFESRQYIAMQDTVKVSRQAAKVVLKVNVNDLVNLSDAAKDRLIALVGPRFDGETGVIRMVSARFPSAEMNREYLKQLLVKLVKEAKVADASE
eukprot:m.106720 g.106720  ORF g.106720 m.106720 type:complete len:343 (-) comp16913_c0_seq9:2981-4009(-)